MNRHKNIWTFRLIESMGPEGRCFEKLLLFILEVTISYFKYTRGKKYYFIKLNLRSCNCLGVGAKYLFVGNIALNFCLHFYIGFKLHEGRNSWKNCQFSRSDKLCMRVFLRFRRKWSGMECISSQTSVIFTYLC